MLFSHIDSQKAEWLERPFSEEEARSAVFDLGGARATSPMVFRWLSSIPFGR